MTLTITDAAPSAHPPEMALRDPPDMALRYVFVYGTLRRDQERDINRLLPKPIFVGTCQTPGTLYHLGACNYPGVRLGGLHWVQGEVYRITPALESQLDVIEHVAPQPTGEYTKREITVWVRSESGGAASRGVELNCLTYELAAQRGVGMRVIASGDWLKRG